MKPQKGHALFYSVESLELFKKLSTWLPEQHPALKFAFLDDTFSDWSRWRPGQKGNMLPTSRLLWRWVLMNEKTERDVKPALENPANDVVLVCKFGREAYHYAIKYMDCEQVLHFHKGLVESRVIGQGVPPPVYIVKKPTDERMVRADLDYFGKDPKQKIRYLHANSIADQCKEVHHIMLVKLKMLATHKKLAA